jgi:RHS repeat-associated protein
VTDETRDGSATSASYDAYGRLATYTRTGTPSFAMLYSGTDERVQVSVDGTPRRFVHDESGRVIGEYGATGTVFAEHVWLMPDTDEGGWEPLALLGASTLSYVHGDHLGVPVQITDASGATVNATQADPFGQRFYTASTSAPRTSLALPGQIIDIADRHYNLYRDYDPTLGRYLQADPIGLEGGDNVYGYVGGNPVGWIDPTGEFGVLGALAGGGLDVAFQVLVEGKSLKCVNWTQVGIMSAAGAITGGGASAVRLGNAWRAANRSMETKNAVRRFRRFHDVPRTHDVHHWLFRDGGSAPNWLKNHPMNLNSIPRRAHRLVHRADTSLARKWWLGHPNWAKAAETSIPLGFLIDQTLDSCGC